MPTSSLNEQLRAGWTWLWAKPARALILALAVFVALDAIASLWLPLGWDAGMMASVGDVIAHGGMPYRDAWELKGPFAFIPFAVSSALFHNSMWGIRLIEILVLAPSLVVLFRVMRGWMSDILAGGAVLTLYLWISAAGFSFTGQPEVWCAAAIAVAMCFILRRDAAAKANIKAFLIVGGLIGLAGVIKPHFLGFGLAPLLFLGLAASLTLERRFVLALSLAIGAAIPVMLAVAWLMTGDATDSVLEIVRYIAGPYGGNSGHSLPLDRLHSGMAHYLVSGPTLVLIPLAAYGAWVRRRESILIPPLLLWLAIAIVGVAIQRKLYAYHWFLMYPPLAFCAALGVHALLQRTSRVAPFLAGACMLALVVQVSISPLRDVARWGRLLINGDWEQYYSGYYMAAYNARDIVLAADYLRNNTADDETVFVWGNDATIRFLSGRANPTRFGFALPLELESEEREAYRAEFIERMTKAPPTYIAVGSPWGEAGPFGSKADSWANFPDFENFLKNRYELEASFGNVDLYVYRFREGDGRQQIHKPPAEL